MTTFKLNTIVQVEELSNYDMIYIYHHLHEGSLLHIAFHETTLNGDLRYQVNYRGFKLGFITIKGFLKEFIKDTFELTAEIVALSKKKYLPLEGLDIRIQAVEMKKVS